MRLKEKVAIITGAAHGIGKAYARRFAEEGAHVVIADIDGVGGEAVAKSLLDSGGSAWARRTDVRVFAEVQGLMQESVERFGRIDVLLNNAAIYVTQKLWKGPVEELVQRADSRAPTHDARARHDRPTLCGTRHANHLRLHRFRRLGMGRRLVCRRSACI